MQQEAHSKYPQRGFQIYQSYLQFIMHNEQEEAIRLLPSAQLLLHN
jgi:hypothetical protein